ncbi:MAG TPA: universal stress protein [Fulvivirga sp.]|nr:universal stress protein [Fulvivirga sp.]
MKKILVPIDFSSQAKNALYLAMQLAKKSGAKLFLLNMVEIPAVGDPLGMSVSPLGSKDFMTALLDERKKRMNEFISKIEEMPDHKLLVNMGNVFDGIMDTQREEHIDLIVMGTKGASGVKEFLIGSNTEKIVRRASCPVLAVREKAELDSLRNIVFPTTGNELDEDLITYLKQFQNLTGSKIHMVRVNTPNNFERDVSVEKLLDTLAKRFMLKDYTVNVFNDTAVDVGIMNFATSIDADVIAMATHGRTGLDHFVSGSLAEDIVNHNKILSWTYRIKKQ